MKTLGGKEEDGPLIASYVAIIQTFAQFMVPFAISLITNLMKVEKDDSPFPNVALVGVEAMLAIIHQKQSMVITSSTSETQLAHEMRLDPIFWSRDVPTVFLKDDAENRTNLSKKSYNSLLAADSSQLSNQVTTVTLAESNLPSNLSEIYDGESVQVPQPNYYTLKNRLRLEDLNKFPNLGLVLTSLLKYLDRNYGLVLPQPQSVKTNKRLESKIRTWITLIRTNDGSYNYDFT